MSLANAPPSSVNRCRPGRSRNENPHAALRFPHPARLSRCPAGRRAGGVTRPRPGEPPAQRAPPQAGRRTAAVQRPRRRMAGPARRHRQARADGGRRRAHASAAAAGRPAFSVRPAQARPARLPGAEGGGDGRLASAAGAHPAYPGGAGQSRAHARQRDRSGAAVRHYGAARGCGAAAVRGRAWNCRCRPLCWCFATKMPR